MAMSGSARGDAVYTAVAAANPNFSKLSAGEQATLKAYFETMFGADTTYITGNMDVLPTALSGTSLEATAGIPVATSGSATNQTGATTAVGPLTGKGSVQ